MKASDIPVKFAIPFANSAGGGFITYPIPTPPTGTNAASLTQGFPPATMTPGGYPLGPDFNGLEKQITQWSRWQGAGGTVPWDSTFSTAIGGYPQGATVASATTFGQFWLSISDDNTDNPDTGTSSNWTGFAFGPTYAVDSGTANALVAALSPAPPNFAYLTGRVIVIKKSASANTTASTLNLNALGAKSIIHGDGTALQPGELPASKPFIVISDGTNYILQSVASVIAAIVANSITNAKLAVMAAGTVKGNITGSSATPVDVPTSSLGVVPVGAVFWFAANTPPTGYLECSGQSVLRAGTYANLFAVIGTTFGSDSTHFNVPDLRGAFIRGWDDSAGVDPGRTFGSFQADALKSHNHGVAFGTDNSPTTIPGHGGGTTASTNTTSTGGTETRPLNYALLPCIKY